MSGTEPEWVEWTIYQVHLETAMAGEVMLDTELVGLANALGDSLRRLDNLPDHEDHADAVVDEEQRRLEALTGLAFVACQVVMGP